MKSTGAEEWGARTLGYRREFSLFPFTFPLSPSKAPLSRGENCNKTYDVSQLLTFINYDDSVKQGSVFYTLLNK